MLARTVRSCQAPALLAGAWLCVAAAAAGAASERRGSQITEDLYDTQFVDAEQGWAVGTFGSVYHTIDGGRTWQAQPTPTTQHLYAVSFADVRNGWAVGRSGEILHTEDGGLHWAEQRSPTRRHLFDVAFPEASEGWAVGDWGAVLHTADGGATWQDRSLPADQIVYAVDFLDRDRGWMVGELGVILHTRDGGRSWLVQRGRREAASIEQTGVAELLDDPGLYDVEIRGGKGYVVGDAGNVLVSEDGGETWTGLLLPAPWRLSWIRGLSVLPSGRGMLVGAAGLTFVAEGPELRSSQAPR